MSHETAAVGSRDFQDILETAKQQFGLQHVTYYLATAPSCIYRRKVLLTTYPSSWIDTYFQHDYQRHDPVLAQGQFSSLPFTWDRLSRRRKSEPDFFAKARCFGIAPSGLTIPIWGNTGECALFSVVPSETATVAQRFAAERLADLCHAARIFHEALKRTISEEPSKLSKREVEVLEWAARGKTAWETGQILELSEKTITFYLRNASKKLGVMSKTAAVAQAVAARLIHL